MEPRKTNKRSAIMKATMELVAENGFHATPTSMIASRAGVGVGSIYRYFKDKDELILEIHRELEGRLLSIIQENYSDQLSIRDRFCCLFGHLFDYLLTNPTDFLFLEQFYNSPYGIACRREGEGDDQHAKPLEKLFIDGKTQHILKDLPQEVLFALTIGPLIVLNRDQIGGFIQVDEKILKKTLEACWDAIRR